MVVKAGDKMKKKVITLAALALVGLVIAKAGGVNLNPKDIGKPIIRPKPSYYPEVSAMTGVAVDQTSLEVLPAVFLKIRTSREFNYLIIGEDFYSVEKLDSSFDPTTHTRIIRYETEEGDILTIVAKTWTRKGWAVTIIGTFGDYILNFEPEYRYVRPVRRIEEVEETRVPKGVKGIRKGYEHWKSKRPGAPELEKLLRKAKPIEEWTK